MSLIFAHSSAKRKERRQKCRAKYTEIRSGRKSAGTLFPESSESLRFTLRFWNAPVWKAGNIRRCMTGELPMKNTTLCYIEKEDSYLLLHRTKKGHDFNKDKWIGVGGKFEDKESPEECLLREVKEETGLDLISWRWHGIVTFVSDEYPTEYMYLYTSSDYTGSLIDCDEGELEWVPKSRIFELPIWPGDRIFLHLMQTGIPFFSLKLVYRKDRLIAVKLNHREPSPEEIGSLISSPI